MGRIPASWAAMIAGAALSLSAAQSQAATWLVTYQAMSGNPFAANLTVETADALNAAGGYDVTGVSGNVDGDAITGVITNPNQPWASYTPDGMFIIDNVLFAAAPNVSWYGLFLSGASGDEYNLYSDNASTYELYRARAGVGYLANSVGSLVVAAAPVAIEPESVRGGAIPEPGAWVLMILGFGGIGAALRRRRSAVAAAG